MENKVRLDYIDYAKGIGILLMVIGHYEYLNHAFMQWIFSFHMPMFFLFSGYLDYRFNLKTNAYVYVKKRVYSLLIPYIAFSLIVLVLEYVIGKNRDIVHGLVSALYYIEDPGFWFFFLLYITDMFFLFYRKIKQGWIKVFFLLALFAISLLTSWNAPVFRTLPFKAHFWPSCFFYFVIGALLAEKAPFFDSVIKEKNGFWGGVFLLSILIFLYVGLNDIFIWVFIARPHYALIALVGSLLIITVGIIIAESQFVFLKKALKYCAINAIVICVFHSKIFWLVRIIDPLIGVDPDSWLSHIIVIIAEIGLLMPTIYVFNHFFPFLVGKRKS